MQQYSLQTAVESGNKLSNNLKAPNLITHYQLAINFTNNFNTVADTVFLLLLFLCILLSRCKLLSQLTYSSSVSSLMLVFSSVESSTFENDWT